MKRLCEVALAFVVLAASQSGAADTLVLNARSRVEVSESGGKDRVVLKRLEWNPGQTAIILCDMWDQHWCQGATVRVGQLAPFMDEVVSEARNRGMLIIHAPSGTMDHYEKHPARERARGAPKASDLPDGIGDWCRWIDDEEQQAGYPIDHSDGGCDCQPQCKQHTAWSKQVESIRIDRADAISDSGAEIWSLLEQRGVKNVILMGVHTNMCVLGRPFGLRNMARFGKNVVLMRDLTDTMYNSRMPPNVPHFTGTDLVVAHIEKYVCPTVTSTVLTGRPAFIFRDDERPRVVFLSAESEYGAVQSIPDFARELELRYGMHCDVLQGSAERNSEDRHRISGMEALVDADLAVVFARRRAFPADQMKHLRDYLQRGGPLIGLRTASHAFDTRGNAPEGHAEWRTFDPEVLGGNYHGHYGEGPQTTATAAEGASGHVILSGVQLPMRSVASLYQTAPLAATASPLLIGAIPDKEPEPVAWTHMYGRSRVFYTSLGHVGDFANPQFRKMLVNAVFWAMNKPVPSAVH